MKAPTALITGCTSGIGLHLAREFAKNGHDLVLVAPVEEELVSLRAELSAEFGIHAHVIPKDLADEDSADEIYQATGAADIDVGILVNNAGQGHHDKFSEYPVAIDEMMVRLNILAPLRLTKLFLNSMIACGEGRILNTASIAGFEPGPMLAVYHASKAFVLSWSEALAVELENTGVKVTILCPGATDTDFFPKSGMEDVVAFQKGKVMSPQEVAHAGYEGMMKNDLIVVPGIANKMLVAARRFLPEEAQARLNQKMYQPVPPDEQERERGDIENKDPQASR